MTMKIFKKYYTIFIIVALFAGKDTNAQHLYIKTAFYLCPGSGGGIGTQYAAAVEGKITKRIAVQFGYTYYYLCHYDCIAKDRIIPEIRYYVYKAGMFEGYVNASYSYTIESVNPEEGDFYKEYHNSLGLGFGNKFVFSKWVSMELGVSPLITMSNLDKTWRGWLRFTFLLGIKIL